MLSRNVLIYFVNNARLLRKHPINPTIRGLLIHFHTKKNIMKRKKLLFRLLVFVVTFIVTFLILHNWDAIIAFFSG